MYFKCYAFLKNYHILPTNKPFLEQSIKFMNVVEYCDRIGAQLNASEKEQNRIEGNLETQKRQAFH